LTIRDQLRGIGKRLELSGRAACRLYKMRQHAVQVRFALGHGICGLMVDCITIPDSPTEGTEWCCERNPSRPMSVKIKRRKRHTAGDTEWDYLSARQVLFQMRRSEQLAKWLREIGIDVAKLGARLATFDIAIRAKK
jgi:hypothetical protein